MLKKCIVMSLIVSIFFCWVGLSSGQATEQVTVAVMAPLSGPYASEGESYINNVLMAADEINKLGGINGKQIKVIRRDTKTNPDVTRERLTMLLSETQIDILCGGLSDAVDVAIAEFGERKHILTLITCQYSHGVFPVPYKYVFFGASTIRHTFLAPTAYIFDTVEKSKKGQKWYLLSADYAFGQSGEKYETEYLETRGVRIVGKQRHPLGTSDYSTYIPRILTSGADVLVLNNFGTDTVNCIKQLVNYGVKEKMVILVPTTSELSVKMLGPKASKGVYFGTPWDYKLDYDSTKSYVANYKARFGKLPTAYGAWLYKIKEIFKVANEVGLENKDKIVRALEEREFALTKEYVRFRSCDHATWQKLYIFRGKGPEEQIDPSDIWEPLEGVWGPLTTYVATIPPWMSKK